jgi:hypothetical protein
MNLVFAETIIATFGIPVDTVASFQHGWKMGKVACLTTGFILTTTGKHFHSFLITTMDKPELPFGLF